MASTLTPNGMDSNRGIHGIDMVWRGGSASSRLPAVFGVPCVSLGIARPVSGEGRLEKLPSVIREALRTAPWFSPGLPVVEKLEIAIENVVNVISKLIDGLDFEQSRKK